LLSSIESLKERGDPQSRPFPYALVEHHPMNSKSSPPSLYEIFLFPIGAALVIEGVHTKRNELPLLFAPFLVVVIRLFIAQFQIPRTAAKSNIPLALKACRAAVNWNQISAVVLLLFEFTVVIAGSIATDPNAGGAILGVWAVMTVMYLIYILLRLVSRQYYIKAMSLVAENKVSSA
jgi:hypothetical protein